MKEMVGGCCVCSDERGWPENPLVYCDGQGCTVAVHQACYGIVQVPTGPWYCRKCESQERSARVRCELCPSRDGALKKTDNQGWAHVVCALYIPEVRFGNVTTMEPIILQLIPQERYSKTCYICQELGKPSRANAGACMQCNKSGCKQQFHVTCAQQLGLLCEEAGNYLDNVKYCGYCQHHYSKLKKGGNVKTIPPYKPITHETNSSDNPSSPEKDGESSTNLALSNQGASSNSNSKLRPPQDPLAPTSTLTSSKPRKSGSSGGGGGGASSSNSNISKNNSISSSTSNLSANLQGSSGTIIGSQSISSSIVTSNNNTNSSSTINESNKNHNLSSSSSSSSSSGSVTKDKEKHSKNSNKISSSTKNHEKNKSSKSSGSTSAGTMKEMMGQPPLTHTPPITTSHKDSKSNTSLSSSAPVATTLASVAQSRTQTSASMSVLASNASPNQATTSSITSSSSVTSLPTMKDGLGQKFTTSNFKSVDSVVVNSESVFVHAKKRKADSRTISTSEDYNRDIIKDVTVTLVPLALDKIEAAECNKKAKTDIKPSTTTTNSGLDTKNVIPSPKSFIQGHQSPHEKQQSQVITQVHSTPLIKAATLKVGGIGGDQQHSLLQQQMLQQQPSLVVSVPLSTANVPGVNLPSNTNATIVSPHQSQQSSLYQQLTQRNPEQLFHSNFQQNPQLNRASPIVHLQQQQQQNHQNLIVQHNQHIVERQSPLIQSGNSVLSGGIHNSTTTTTTTSTAPVNNQQSDNGQQSHLSTILPSNVSVLQRSSAVSPTAIPSNHTINDPNSGSSGILKITYEKQTTTSRINTLQDDGRRSRSQSGDGINHGTKMRGAKKRALLGGQASQTSPSTNNPSPSETMSNTIATNVSTVSEMNMGSHNSNNASTIISRNDYGVITNISNSGSNNNNGSSKSNNIFEAAAAVATASSAGIVESLSSYIGGSSVTNLLAAGPTNNNTNINNNQNNGTNNTSNNYKKKFRSSSNETPPPPPPSASNSRQTPDNLQTSSSFSANSGSFGGLKFSYESQSTTTTAPPQTNMPTAAQVKDSPPSSPGSDELAGAKKRARKSFNESCSTSNTSSSLSNVTASTIEMKDGKLFQNGVSGHVQHMLGNAINPASNVAHKLTDQLNMEIEAHSVYNSSSLDSAQSLIGPQFPGKNTGQSLRTPANSGPSLSAMLGGTATATASGNTPQSLEQLLERQWEQGSQFLMEQAQHFDIASLLSCLHQLRTENVRLEEHVNNLVARRDHLLAVNARLAIPLNPPTSTGQSNQVPFNNMHINGPTELLVSTTTTSTPTSRNSNRNSSQQQLQQQSMQQQPPQQPTQTHYSGSTLPVENGIDFRHQHAANQSSGGASVDRRQSYSSSSAASINRQSSSGNDGRSSGATGSRNISTYQSQQQTSNYSLSSVVHQSMPQQRGIDDLGHHLKPR